jgi:hypothetical protein
MSWFWMNIPLEAAFLAVWIGIPMWLVFRHPDRGPDAATSQLTVELEVLISPAADVVLSESLERVALAG